MLQRQATPLREQAVDELREKIVRGEFRPGERLKERVLVELLKVSRTVVREALRQLEAERLIRIEPQVGPVVREPTPDEARQLYEVRAALETAAARLAALHRTDEQAQQLRESLQTLEVPLAPVEDLLAAKTRFYTVLVEASHNQIIGEQLDGIQARASQLRLVTMTTPGRGQQMLSELRRVVEAILDHDPQQAYQASLEHVQAAAAIALEHLTTQTENA